MMSTIYEWVFAHIELGMSNTYEHLYLVWDPVHQQLLLSAAGGISLLFIYKVPLLCTMQLSELVDRQECFSPPGIMEEQRIVVLLLLVLPIVMSGKFV